MHGLNALGNLLKYAPDPHLLHFLALLSLEVQSQTFTFEIFKHQVELTVLLKTVIILDHILMVKFLQDLGLFQCLFLLLLSHMLQIVLLEYIVLSIFVG